MGNQNQHHWGALAIASTQLLTTAARSVVLLTEAAWPGGGTSSWEKNWILFGFYSLYEFNWILYDFMGFCMISWDFMGFI